MDMFDKVDTLRERANVSYEEAKDALDRANGDILDAMILLEREGKTRREDSGAFSTNDCTESAFNEKQARKERIKENSRTFGEKVKELFRKSTVNYLVVEHKGEMLFKIPVLAFVLILLFAWYAAVIAVVVSLFCGCKYSFVGEGDMAAVNNVCNRAGELAIQVKDKVVDEYNKL
ncbi:MAG: DUF4342 domain-containing protein [Lachnospiraceae bacterium]|nr:DUF4342 domain-containing protein [Lachnospiraceae bacterium]